MWDFFYNIWVFLTAEPNFDNLKNELDLLIDAYDNLKTKIEINKQDQGEDCFDPQILQEFVEARDNLLTTIKTGSDLGIHAGDWKDMSLLALNDFNLDILGLFDKFVEETKYTIEDTLKAFRFHADSVVDASTIFLLNENSLTLSNIIKLMEAAKIIDGSAYDFINLGDLTGHKLNDIIVSESNILHELALKPNDPALWPTLDECKMPDTAIPQYSRVMKNVLTELTKIKYE